MELFPINKSSSRTTQFQFPKHNLIILSKLLFLYETGPIPLRNPGGGQAFKNLNKATFRKTNENRHVVVGRSGYHPLHFLGEVLSLEEKDVASVYCF